MAEQVLVFTATTAGTFTVKLNVSFEAAPVESPLPETAPPPPPAPLRRAAHIWHKHNQVIGTVGSSALWSSHAHMRTRLAFSAVQAFFINPGTTLSGPIDRAIAHHMIGIGPTGGLHAQQWRPGADDIIVPAGVAPNVAQRPGYAVGNIIDCAPMAADDGGPAHVMLRADATGAVWHSKPAGYDAAAFAALAPHYPMTGWRRYGSWAATPATAGTTAAGWIEEQGQQTAGGLIFHHATPAATWVDFGDSTVDGDMVIPGLCNYLSAGWLAANALAAEGVPISFARFSQGGAKWDDKLHQVQQAIAVGAVGPGVVAWLPTFTSNDAAQSGDQAAWHWQRSQQLVALCQAAGATPALIGPMCATTSSATRLAVRAQMLASGLPCADTGAAIGLPEDPSVFAPGMCGDPTGPAVHPSHAANLAMAAQRKAVFQGVLA